MKRIVIALCTVAFVGASAGLAWRLWPIRNTFYTDADAIRQPMQAVVPRAVLWQPAKPLEDILNSSADDYEPRLSADGLTLFFVRGKAGHNADIYTSRRSFDGWDEPQPVVGANSQYDDLGPEPSIDGQTLYFYSNREGGLGGYDLWMSRGGEQGWQAATNLGPSVNSQFNDYGPAVTSDGQALYFASNRPQPGDSKVPDPNAWSATLREDLFSRTYDLYASSVTDAGFGRAEAIAPLNTPFNEGAPAVSPFGDFVYFASDRPGGSGGFDLYRSRRLRGEHSAPINLGEAVNTATNELDPALSMGGYGLSFSSDRPAAKTAARSDYNLYHTTSREVFTEVEEVPRAPMDWAALWRAAGPNVLWALLSLLLLVFMLALFRGMRDKRLSLIMKCLLASLAAHLLLMLLFNTWEVAATLGEFAGGRRGPIKVSLGSTGSGQGITAQIRGGLTKIDLRVAAPVPSTHRAESSAEIAATVSSVQLALPRAAVATTAPLSPATHMVESAPVTGSRRNDWSVPIATATATVEVRLPGVFSPSDFTEADPRVGARITAPSAPVRAEVSSSVPRIVPAAVPILSYDAFTGSALSLAVGSEARDAVPQTMTPSPMNTPASGFVPGTMGAGLGPSALRVPEETAGAYAEPAGAGRVSASGSAGAVRRTSSSSEFAATPETPFAVTVAPPKVELPGGASSIAQHGDSADSVNVRTQWAGSATLQALGTAGLSSASLAPLPGTPLALPSEAATGSPPPVAAAAARTSVVGHGASVRAMPVQGGAAGLTILPGRLPTKTRRFDSGGWGTSLAAVSHSPREAQWLQGGGRLLSPEQSATAAPALPTLTLPALPEELPPDSPYVQRFADDRLEIVERMGGSEKTENAVERALQWLAAHQSADGGWNGENFDRKCGECGGETSVRADHALTGLGLLCFLGAGHTATKDGPYKEAVERGLRRLVSRQKPDGDLRGEETLYSHGIATIALSEAFAMTGDVALREPVQQAVAFIERARNRNIGGWRYDPGQAGDTSVLGWQVMALKSATMAGLEVSQSSFDAAGTWLQRVADRRNLGRYSYQPGRDATPSMTAEAMFVQQLLGTPPTSSRTQGSVKFVMQHLPQWSSANTYYWYYATLALFQHQGEAWQQWNAAMQEQLLAHQRTDGRAAGSWDPVGEWAEVGGRIYQTALCTLMLEVYYRYLPLYWLPEPTGDDASAEAQSIGTIRGRVTSAESGASLFEATVRLTVPDRESIEVATDADGTYLLGVPPVPEFFALSATHDGFVPQSMNVERERLEGQTIEVNFLLKSANSAILVTEAAPDVHHLGDNHFDGTINSQFQKRAEGAAFAVQFELSEDQLPPRFNRAEVKLLAKGVQRSHRIVINGETLQKRLNKAPEDGSFGEFSAPFSPSILNGGSNKLEIIAAPSVDDIDDFEFVNVQIHLAP